MHCATNNILHASAPVRKMIILLCWSRPGCSPPRLAPCSRVRAGCSLQRRCDTSYSHEGANNLRSLDPAAQVTCMVAVTLTVSVCAPGVRGNLRSWAHLGLRFALPSFSGPARRGPAAGMPRNVRPAEVRAHVASCDRGRRSTLLWFFSCLGRARWAGVLLPGRR